jgi:hypothetical protein
MAGSVLGNPYPALADFPHWELQKKNLQFQHEKSLGQAGATRPGYDLEDQQ